MLDPAGFFGGTDRQLPGDPPGAAPAKWADRAGRAERLGIGKADRLPQLHHRLVEDAGGILRYLRQHHTGELFFDRRTEDIVPAGGQPGKHPQYVSIHRRGPAAIGDGRHGPGGIVSDPGQAEQILHPPYASMTIRAAFCIWRTRL